jgi:hypothetical protein
MDVQPIRRARWKSAVLMVIALLVLIGLFVVLFNLPIVTGDVPQ